MDTILSAKTLTVPIQHIHLSDYISKDIAEVMATLKVVLWELSADHVDFNKSTLKANLKFKKDFLKQVKF